MIVHFNDAQPGQCRYALWPDSEKTGLICGSPVQTGSSYCREHHGLVYEKPTKERLQTLAVVAGRIVGHAARRQGTPNIHPEFEETK